MTSPFDVYVDDFALEIGPYGALITVKTAVGAAPPGTVKGRLRMSVEHMKVLTLRLHQLIVQVEKDHKVTYPLSAKTLNAIRVREEDWEIFWKG